ncbi:hypothetical protein KSW81_002997 [Nannochloris sp. 'desiccata']|nr:hypothetical protein KSW81_002997 [Chlorella desiccata (nom. nud.)]
MLRFKRVENPLREEVGPSCDYKALFLGVNGWRRPSSQEIQWSSAFRHACHAAPPLTASAISCSPASSSANLQACTMSPDHIISLIELSSPRETKRSRKVEGDEEEEEEGVEAIPLRSTDTASSPIALSSYQSQRMPFHITSARPCSIQCLDYAKGIVAVGDVRGSLHIVHLPPPSPLSSINFHRNNSEKLEGTSSVEEEEEEEEEEELEVDAFIAPPTQQYPITCFEYHRPSTRLFCLWDRGECGTWRPNDNGIVRIFDVENQQLVSSLKETLDYYELCTILCPSRSSSSPASHDTNGAEVVEFDSEGGGNQLIAGTVKLSQDRWINGACPRCNLTLPASLCWHQHRSSNAALAFFDLRAGESPGRMVNRHPLPHRSLYPRLQLVRDHYLLASHAGTPLVIWDRRFLDGRPVATPQLVLDNFNHYSTLNNYDSNSTNKTAGSGTGGGARGLRGGRNRAVNVHIPDRLSNALYLSCYGSMLAGRADNGEIGVWDLSNILGWWNKNTTGHSCRGCGGGTRSTDNLNSTAKDISEGIARLQLEQGPDKDSSITSGGGSNSSSSNSSGGGRESSNWKRPVFSAYVPMRPSAASMAEEGEEAEVNNGGGGGGVIVRPRAEVWIGPDWLAAATGQGQLQYFHL